LRTHPAPPPESSRLEASKTAKLPLQTVVVVAAPTSPVEGASTATRKATQEEQQRQTQEKQNPLPSTPPKDDEDSIMDCDLTQQACLTRIVQHYPVVVFSKPWCPYCRKALEALAALGLAEGHNANLKVIDLSSRREVQSTLQAMTGRRTVPNVFVGGKSIGGGDETSKYYRDGSLKPMLVAAKAFLDEADQNQPPQQPPADRQAAGNDKGGTPPQEVAVVEGEIMPCDDLTQESCITKLVHQHPVVVFSKQTCPHCRRALEALALEGLSADDNPNLHIVNLSQLQKAPQIQDQLERMTGRRTVPNVFVAGTSIGGGSETVQLQQSGELRTLLQQSHAILIETTLREET